MYTRNENKQLGRLATLAALLLTVAAGLAIAQTGGGFDLTWNTYNGGGATFSAGGGFSLGGTIAQPDAGPTTGPMTSGGFSLVGGFWPVGLVCYCAGDLNGDGAKNGKDIQKFLDCVIASGAGNCTCADMDGANGVTIADVSVFVTDLLGGAACP